MNSLRSLFFGIFLIVFSLNGQVVDTLSYFDPDSTEECAYIGDLANLGVMFEPNIGWDRYNIIALEIQHITADIMTDQPITFYNVSDFFPGNILDTLWVPIPDTSELYPEWIHYDLTEHPLLQNISGPFSVTGSPLLSFLCDFGTPSEATWAFSYQQQIWSPSGDFPIRAIVEYRTSSIDDPILTSKSLSIEKLFPNPFNPSLTIIFNLEERAELTLSAFDILGRETQISVKQVWDSGHHKVTWQPVNKHAGVYFISLKSGTQRAIKKCLFIK